MIVRLTADDPLVLVPSRVSLWKDVPPSGTEYDIPDELATEYLAALRAFEQAEFRLSRYLRAVNRDATAYQPAAEVNRRRLERGRRRHYRRARP